MKKIINTTSDKLEVRILGRDYVLEPKGFLMVPSDVADYWQNMLHRFLEIEEVAASVQSPVKEVDQVIEVEKEVEVSKAKKTVKK